MINTIHSDLIRGHINTIILKTLYEGDKYGYDIVRAIDQKSSGQYKMKQPTLYSCLKRLENQGLVSAYWGARSNGGRRRYYTLTEAGTNEFLKNQADWEYSKGLIDKLITANSIDLDLIAKEIESDETDSAEEELDDCNEAIEEESLDATEQDLTDENDLTNENISDESNLAIENTSDESNSIIENISDESDLIKTNNTQLSEDKSRDNLESNSDLNKLKFADTTAIMNTLINGQLDSVNDKSYVDKIITEKYSPVSAASSESYFKDFEDEQEDEQSELLANDVNNYDTPLSAPQQTTDNCEDDANLLTPSTENILDRINQKYSFLKEQSAISDSNSQKALDKMPPPPLSIYDIERQNLEKSRIANEKATADKTNSSSIFISYDSLSPAEIDEKKSYITREYKNILSSLVKNSLDDFKKEQSPTLKITDASAVTPAVPQANCATPLKDTLEGATMKIGADEQASLMDAATEEEYALSPVDALTRDQEVNKKLNKLTNSVRELGDNVKIRTHNNDSSKEYNSEYYYYSNKLMLVHYAILFGIMLLEVVVSFLFIRIGLNITTKYDLIIYLLGIIFAASFPFSAFLMNLYNPEKRKRINFNFRSSLMVRMFFLIQSLFIIYFINVIFKMPLTLSLDYLPSLIMPALLTTNIPLSSIIFNALYKSKKYSVGTF